jgi:RNA polymerase sigma-54 factor
MALHQSLNIRQEQKLVMTPQLQMAIKLLQMPMMELQTFIGQELVENPFLEQNDGMEETDRREVAQETDSSEVDSASALESGTMENGLEAMDTDWDNMYDNGKGASGQMGGALDDDGLQSWERTATEEITLRDHLESQLGVLDETPTVQFVTRFLIDAIDDSGYLRIELSEVAERLNVKLPVVEDALELIQTFEPAGIGARGLKECLMLQLELECKLKGETLESACLVVKNLELMAAREFKKLAKLAKCTEEEVSNYCALITTLTPKPGLQFGTDVATSIIPDVIVMRKEGVWRAELNADAMPKVLLNKGMDNFAPKATGDKEYIAERVNRASWLVKSLEQRARTIYKVAGAIVEAQEDFFNYGVESLQPLTLKMVAEKVEAHESTVSRVTNGKYMQTPMGVFELKYFFSSAINTTGGQVSVAAISVKSMIKRLIGTEDATKPLSDEKLVQLLKSEGVDVARRTVAKYREALGIQSSSKRKIRA